MLIAVSTHVFTQSYSITPNDTIIGEVPLNDLYHFNIEQQNLTAGNLLFSWQQIEAVVPEGWTAYLCDNGFCYDNFPLSGSMDTVFNGDYGLMSVAVNPAENLGMAFIQYIIWEESTPGQIDTLTWMIDAVAPTGLPDHSTANRLTVYPVPADQFIIVENEASGSFDYFVNDLQGKNVLSGKSGEQTEMISVERLPAGFYILIVLHENQMISRQTISIQH